MLIQLRRYYDQNRIGAESFACPHFTACSANAPDFTTTKESFVGPSYEEGTVPRVVFLSLDSGSASREPRHKTLQAVRESELSENVNSLPRGKHWYLTHEFAWTLLQQFRPTLRIADTSPLFAHVNSAKCCLNKPQRSQADSVLFKNCRTYVPGELAILSPDIIVTQGAPARVAIESQGTILRRHSRRRDGIPCEVAVVRCGAKEALWISTHHPRAYGQFWPQKNACWASYAEAVGRFVRGDSLDDWEADSEVSSKPVRLPRRLIAPSRPPGPGTANFNLQAGASSTKPDRPAPLHSIDDLIARVRTVNSAESFQQFLLRMHQLLPGPRHRHIGLLSGLRVQSFQNWLLDRNLLWRLTDAQLLAVLRVEFPHSSGKVVTGDLSTGLGIIKGIRAHYNRDGHHGPSPQSRGMPASVSYGRY